MDAVTRRGPTRDRKSKLAERIERRCVKFQRIREARDGDFWKGGLNIEILHSVVMRERGLLEI